METKKQYIKPTVKCVAFKAEVGFAMSNLSQSLSSFGSSKEEYNFSEDPKNVNGNRFGGYFTGNNDDWD